jgi:hypothetical protein
VAEYELFVDEEFTAVGTERKAFGGFSEAPSGTGAAARQVEPVSIVELEEMAKSGEERVMELRDPVRVGTIRVQAKVAKSPEEMPEGDTLWTISTGGRFGHPWGVKITADLEEEADEVGEVAAIKRGRPSLAERRGRILVDLLKEREEKGRKKKEGGE